MAAGPDVQHNYMPVIKARFKHESVGMKSKTLMQVESRIQVVYEVWHKRNWNRRKPADRQTDGPTKQ